MDELTGASGTKFVTVESAAEILGMHIGSVRRLYRQKKLQGFMFMGRIMFPKIYIENLAQERSRQ